MPLFRKSVSPHRHRCIAGRSARRSLAHCHMPPFHPLTRAPAWLYPILPALRTSVYSTRIMGSPVTLPPAQHIAHFYENDRCLTESVVEFIKAGLQANDRVIIIATASHWQTLRNAFNQDELCHDNFTFFDATVLLAELMVEDWPYHSVFMRVLGHPIQEVCHRGRVRVRRDGGRSLVSWSLSGGPVSRRAMEHAANDPILCSLACLPAYATPV